MRTSRSNRWAEGLGALGLALILVGGTASVAQAAGLCCHLVCGSSWCPQWAVQTGRCPTYMEWNKDTQSYQLAQCVKDVCAAECASCVKCPFGPPPPLGKSCDQSPCAGNFYVRKDKQVASTCVELCAYCPGGLCGEQQYQDTYPFPSNANVYCGCPQ